MSKVYKLDAWIIVNDEYQTEIPLAPNNTYYDSKVRALKDAESAKDLVVSGLCSFKAGSQYTSDTKVIYESNYEYPLANVIFHFGVIEIDVLEEDKEG